MVTPEEFGQIVIRADRTGSIVRLKDVARIELGRGKLQHHGPHQRTSRRGHADLSVAGDPTRSTPCRGVRELMAQLKQHFPEDVDVMVSLDTTQAVTEGISEIVETLLIALVLVALVVFVFLQDWRATLIPLLAVPVSLIGTFMVFPAAGLLHQHAVLVRPGVLAIGLVVDDAIVVVEAVQHHIEQGHVDQGRCLQGAMEEVSAPVIGIAVILAAVFVPTVFVPGITGRLYQQFAITIAISVVISAFNALTLSPALASLLLRHKTVTRGPLGAFYREFNRIFERGPVTAMSGRATR